METRKKRRKDRVVIKIFSPVFVEWKVFGTEKSVFLQRKQVCIQFYTQYDNSESI